MSDMYEDLEGRVRMFLDTLQPLSESDIQDFHFDAPDISYGQVIDIRGMHLVPLDSFENGTTAALMAYPLEEQMNFGNLAMWIHSGLREYLNDELYPFIANILGRENFVTFPRNLITMDGVYEGTCDDNLSLMSFDEYRCYHGILGTNVNYEEEWWLLTRYSSQQPVGVCCVDASGGVSVENCLERANVRPLFMLRTEFVEHEQRYLF